MKRLMIFSLLILCSAAVVDAEIYTWTDEQGMVTFTDNPDSLPPRVSGSKMSGDVIHIQILTAHKGLGTRGTKLQAAIPENRVKSIAARVQKEQLPVDTLSEAKETLAGDQTVPASP